MERCPNCNKNVENNWVSCPYCTTDLRSYQDKESPVVGRGIISEPEFSLCPEDSESITISEPPNILDYIEFSEGQVFDHYTLIQKIGSGHQGIVWLAQDQALKCNKALKIIPEVGELSESLYKEYRLRLGIEDQRFIVRADQPRRIVHLEQGFFIYPMEYLEQGNLHSVMSKFISAGNNREIEDILIKIFLIACESLEYIHSLGIAHNNLKPENIFILSNRAKFSDFSIQEKPKSISEKRFNPFLLKTEEQKEDFNNDVQDLGLILYAMFSCTGLIIDKLEDLINNRGKSGYLQDSIIPVIVKSLTAKQNDKYGTLRELVIDVQKAYNMMVVNRDKVDRLLENANTHFAARSYSEAVALIKKAKEIEPANMELTPLLQSYEQEGVKMIQKQQDKKAFFQGLNFILVHPGSFKMGSIRGQDCEHPVHTVSLDGFFINKYPVSLGDWKEFIRETGYSFDWENNTWGLMPISKLCLDDDYPIVNVSWYEAVEFCNWRSRRESFTPCYSFIAGKYSLNRTANGYRLPTEAEWEYAARGGNQTCNYKYSGGNIYKQAGWTKESTDTLRPVGKLSHNELGLSDMSGNVCEWCYDWCSEYYYKESEPENPLGPPSGRKKVLRGGSWNYPADAATVYARYMAIPDIRREYIGFRLCRSNL